MRVWVWFTALDFGAKLFLVVAAVLLSLPIAAALVVFPVATISTALNPQPAQAPLALVDNTKATMPDEPAEAVKTTEEVVVTGEVPFQALTVDDATMAAGTTAIIIAGVPGSIERTYLVTYLDGVETLRTLKSETVTVAPIDQITSVGTYVAPPPQPVVAPPASGGCDANYADGCVPIASDVDCAGAAAMDQRM